ncbi:TetR/AcrR family transcriptional regulator [Corynebacterium sp. 335C]
MKPTVGDDLPSTRVMDAALEQFTRRGFAETRLDDVAVAAGVTKRQLTYHYGDKRNLYRETVAHALGLIHSPAAVPRPESEVPVEAMRQVLESIFAMFADNALPVQLLTMENTNPVLEPGTLPTVEQAPAILEVDRILLMGRNLGAFRPDASALDVYFLAMALSNLPTLSHGTFSALYGLDLRDPAMRPRLRNLMGDTIIGFLTSAAGPREEGGSYLASDTYTTGRNEEERRGELGANLVDEVYGEEDVDESPRGRAEDPDSPDFGGIVYDE